MRLAENNKKEGNELFRDGNVMHSLERYSKALGHCFKVCVYVCEHGATPATSRLQGLTFAGIYYLYYQLVVGDMNTEEHLRLHGLTGCLLLFVLSVLRVSLW